MKKIIGFFIFLNITLALLTLGAYLAPYFHPRDTVVFALLGLGFPALLIGHIAFIIFWLIVRPKNALGSILVLLLGITSVLNIININRASLPDNAASTIRVASYNMQFSKPVRLNNGNNKLVTETDFKAFLSGLKDMDILCLQEHSTYAERLINQLLKFPYQHHSNGKYVAIYSKYPIVNKGILSQFSTHPANACVWADIAVKGQKIRVYSAHFEPNRGDGTIPKFVVELKKETAVNWSEAFGLAYFYRRFSAKRAEQSKRMQQELAKSPYPTILCGDMNDTPQSHVYYLLKKGQKDTFREKGSGIGATFGSTLKNKLAMLRIDYIFADDTFNILNHHILREPYSDHYLIWSNIQLP